MGPDGLSANFTGKNNEKMSRIKFENKTFRMVVTNDTDKDVTFALTKGTFPSLAEIKKKYADVNALLSDGVFFETTVDGEKQKATCQAIGNTSVAHVQEFFSHAFEGEITDIEVTSTEKENFYEEIQSVVPSPFEAMPAQSVPLNAFLDPGQYDQNRVLANGIRVPLSPLAMVILRIKAHSTIKYSMTITAWDR